MILVITETVSDLIEVETTETILEIADFDIGYNKIDKSVVMAAGDLIIGSASGEVTNISVPNSAGYTLTSDPTNPLKASWQKQQSGGADILQVQIFS
jgi:hypothetical protein